jgi:hypothetical protein
MFIIYYTVAQLCVCFLIIKLIRKVGLVIFTGGGVKGEFLGGCLVVIFNASILANSSTQIDKSCGTVDRSCPLPNNRDRSNRAPYP